MKWFSKKSVKRLSSAVAFSIVAGLNMGGAEAAKGVVDTTINRTIYDMSGITEDLETTENAVYIYSYDKATKEIKGAKLIQTAVGNTKDTSLALRITDLQGLSSTEIKEALNKLVAEKYSFTTPEKAITNQLDQTIRLMIVDDDNKPVLHGHIAYDSETQTFSHVLALEKNKGPVCSYDQQLTNDGPEGPSTAYYGISKDAKKWSNNYTFGMVQVKPDMSRIEGVKAAVKGSENNLSIAGTTSDTKNVVQSLFIDAEGENNEKTYGIYNDAKGSVDAAGVFTVVRAKGDEAVGLYAGNEADYLSKVTFSGGHLTVLADGNGIEAGKNGKIVITPGHYAYGGKNTVPNYSGDSGIVDVRNVGGYGIYAHDGGEIVAAGLVAGRDASKTVAYAENDSKIYLGTKQLENGTVIPFSEEENDSYNKIIGKLATDDNSKIILGLNAGQKSSFIGSTAGNVDLYLSNEAMWNMTGASVIGNFVGANDADGVGGINMQNGDLRIDKFAGFGNVYFSHDAANPTVLQGGRLTIASAAEGAKVQLLTDRSGISYNDNEQVKAVLDALANKLIYSGYVSGERNLSAVAGIGEGLTASSVARAYTVLGFDETNGQAKRVGEVQIDPNNYHPLIVNDAVDPAGYKFDENTVIKGAALVESPGPFPLGDYYAAVESSNVPTVIDMQGHKLTINSSGKGIGSAIYSSSLTGKVEINNCGGMEIFAESSTGGACSALSTNGGGQIIIHNAAAGDTNEQLWDKAVKLTSQSSSYSSATGMTNRNGIANGNSYICIDGLIDMVVDAGVEGGEYKMDGNGVTSIVGGTKIREAGSNCGINSVASTVDIGGGRLICQNGAFSAINAYGEFVSESTGTVNFNIVKDSDGNPIGAGNMPAMIEGNLSTNGGMGTKGRINIGLRGTDSYLKGSYLFSKGYGVTVGEFGGANLFLADGAKWEGSAYGMVHADLDSGSTWSKGFSTNENSILSIRGGASFIPEVPDDGNVNRFAILHGSDTSSNMGGIVIKDGVSLNIDSYTGNTNVFYEHADATPTVFTGGDITIKSAAEGSTINLITGNNGINTASTNYKDKNSVNAVLNALANKLIYSGFASGESNLSGKVKIAEGLTSSSAELVIGDITYNQETGRGFYAYDELVPASTQSTDKFTTAINGTVAKDAEYELAGVTKEDGIYNFTMDSTISTGENLIAGGPYLPNISAAVAGNDITRATMLDLNGSKLTVDTISGTHTTGITAIGNGAKVEINNPGALSVKVESTGGGQSAALFTNGGGSVVVHNGGADQDSRVLTARADTTTVANGAVIKTMNGGAGMRSNIVIDGLVDILADGDTADGKGANEAVSNVASTISIGGGTIKAINGAQYAIRSYGEFQSKNLGYVYVNAIHDGLEGAATGSGSNRLVVEGNIGMAGNMNVLGSINAGFGTKDSSFTGDVNSSSSWGAATGHGEVNLWFTEGSNWTGNNIAKGNGTNVYLDGAVWTGYSSQQAESKTSGGNTVTLGYNLEMKNGSVWNNTGDSSLLSLSGSGSTINMTNAGAGNITIDNYSGNTKVFYAHDAATPTVFTGGEITIKNAAADSKITLATDNTSINLNITPKINEVLNALAEKLTYVAYTTGERNLTGEVEILEGLTSSSATLQTGKISFNESTGKGGLTEGSVTPGGTIEKFETETISGDKPVTENTAVIVTEKDGDAVIAAKGDNTSTEIKAAGKDIVLEAQGGSDKAVTVYANGTGGAVNVEAKNVAINAVGGAESAAIATKDGGAVEIKADDTKIAGNIANTSGIVKVEAAATEVKGNITNDGGTVDLSNAGNTNITGNITNNEGGTMLIGGENKTTVIVGNIVNKGDMMVTLDGAKSHIDGFIDPTPLNLNNGATWNNNVADVFSEVSVLTSNNGIINQTSNKTLTIGELSGKVRVNYNSTYDSGTNTLTVDEAAGNIAIRGVDTTKQNIISINTDKEVGDTYYNSEEKLGATLLALANKLTYTGAVNTDGSVENLTAYASVNEGLVRSSAKAPILFKQGADDVSVDYKIDDVTNTFNGKNNQIGAIDRSSILYGAYETQIMKGSRAAMTSSAMAWRAEANDLMRRMGDLRLSPDQLGAWARFYRGRSASDKDNANYKLNYATIQAGYDWQAGKNWRLGTAISYMEGKSGYDMGSGENKEYNLGFYGTWNDDKGQYVDLIAKIGRLTNDYTVYNESGYKVDGDYGNLGLSLSAEYGKKFRQQSGFYFEPSAELNYTHLNGADYTAHSNYPFGNMRVSQSSFNSLIGRIAVGFGYETPKSTVYAKLSLNHEFCGGLTSSFSAEEFKSIDQNFRDTWVGLQIGGTAKLSDKCNFYGNIEKTFGGDIKTDYRIDAGFRFEF